MTRPSFPVLIAVSLLVLLPACQTNSRSQVLAVSQSQVEQRNYQSCAFDTRNKKKTLRTIIATLQDLGFVVDKADYELGVVSATKLSGYALRMTVTVRDRGKKQTLVRANAEYNRTAVDDPTQYQQFFEALEKSMFLTAHEVD